MQASKGLSLALGGGAARGISHIVILEILDEFGVRPTEIVGCSIGAIMGSGYASGLSGKEIRDITLGLFEKRTNVLSMLWRVRGNRRQKAMSMTDFDPLSVLEIVLGDSIPKNFDDLKIPFRTVATDFHRWEEVILSSGDLHKAVAASMAIPVVFTPVTIGNRLLIDGGVINPLPFDLLSGQSIRLAVDVNDCRHQNPPGLDDTPELPSMRNMAIAAAQMTMQSIVTEKLKYVRPNILIRPPVGEFMAFDFLKAKDILAAVDAEREPIKREIAGGLEVLA